MVYWNGLSMV
jgi:hypothetical protein